VRVWTGLYWHHGIFLGEGRVAEFANWFHGGAIRIVDLPGFSKGRRIDVVEHEHALTPDEVVERAIGRVGEAGYDVVFNNCEHFATWCKTGRSESRQVGRVKQAAVLGLAAGATALTLAARARGRRAS